MKFLGYLLCLVLYSVGLAWVVTMPGNWALIGMLPVVGAAALFKYIY